MFGKPGLYLLYHRCAGISRSGTAQPLRQKKTCLSG
jgi:hypothetical protein